MKPKLEARKISWITLWPAAQPMMLAHHLERKFPQEEFKVDPLSMQALELEGRMILIGGFADEVLIGYLMLFLGTQLGSAKIVLGTQGPWYISPSWRRSRLVLLMKDEAIETLRAAGAYRLRWATDFGRCPSWLRKAARPYEATFLMELR